jgi:hypothetical protein
MKKIAWTVLPAPGACVALALGLDAFLGVTQLALEPGRAEGLLHTFDDEGKAHESRMKALMVKRTGPFRYSAIRTVLLFAEIEPARLDPR